MKHFQQKFPVDSENVPLSEGAFYFPLRLNFWGKQMFCERRYIRPCMTATWSSGYMYLLQEPILYNGHFQMPVLRLTRTYALQYKARSFRIHRKPNGSLHIIMKIADPNATDEPMELEKQEFELPAKAWESLLKLLAKMDFPQNSGEYFKSNYEDGETYFLELSLNGEYFFAGYHCPAQSGFPEIVEMDKMLVAWANLDPDE